MASLIDWIRLRWYMITRALGYGVDFTEILYQTYLNHSKTIHYRKGQPVYSLSTPALFSKPAANFVSRSIYKTIQNRNLPNLMSFAVNDACDAACQHAAFSRQWRSLAARLSRWNKRAKRFARRKNLAFRSSISSAASRSCARTCPS